MTQIPGNRDEQLRLTDEHRMLLHIRDTLYEGSWEDFLCDLRARDQGRPHVFETVPDSPAMRATIESHVAMIEAMQVWEERCDCRLSSKVPSEGEPGCGQFVS